MVYSDLKLLCVCGGRGGGVMGGLYHKMWVVYEEERRDGEGICRSCVITREGMWHSLLVWYGMVW